MTNTRITDSEVFERRYPVLLHRFSLRPLSGGSGAHPGGCGVIREIEFRLPVQVSILSERRVYNPYGMEGGGEGERGLNLWVRRVWMGEEERAKGVAGNGIGEEGNGKYVDRIVSLGGKNSASMKAGERIIIHTPGGGGWGAEGSAKSPHAEVQPRDPTLSWKGGSLASRVHTQETN
jgi:5-oxoprolinase (ATP-hydrolysing)